MTDFDEAPVWSPDLSAAYAYENGDELPGVWVSEPAFDAQGNAAGRTPAMRYPGPEDDDPFGEEALWWGGGYYSEAMRYTDPEDHEKRVECFRAAEVLYRHAAGKGNLIAALNLGYVYSYDRCEGRYWRGAAPAGGRRAVGPAAAGAGASDPNDGGTPSNAAEPEPGGGKAADGSPDPAYPRKERAFECLSMAAEAGIPEACYKLGDLYKHGTGCERSPRDAFGWYSRAAELAQFQRPVILGSIALRLGECFEEGLGCAQDFRLALEWYRRAVSGLGAAVEAGDSWYEKALSGAKRGVKRCEQELGC